MNTMNRSFNLMSRLVCTCSDSNYVNDIPLTVVASVRFLLTRHIWYQLKTVSMSSGATYLQMPYVSIAFE